MVSAVDRQLYHLWQTSPNDSRHWLPANWVTLGREQWPMSSNPAVARNANGRLEVFMVGSDHQLYRTWQTTHNINTEWSEWTSLGGEFP
jgi:hypothetical protein